MIVQKLSAGVSSGAADFRVFAKHHHMLRARRSALIDILHMHRDHLIARSQHAQACYHHSSNFVLSRTQRSPGNSIPRVAR